MSEDAPRLRVLVAHNTYQYAGGEDEVVKSEVALLQQHGHEVACFTRDNHAIAGLSKVKLAVQTMWSFPSARDVEAEIRRFRPDVIHVHNTLPLISPSIYWTAARLRVPVVQTLHNFRLLCPQALLLREDKVCEDCVGRVPWRGVMHGCYRHSPMQTAVVGGMLVLHRSLGTWQDKVQRYIALNEFCRRKFIDGGLPADRVVVKPNFVDLPPPPDMPRGEHLLFVGRLSHEKGIVTLAEAVRRTPGVQVRAAGTGPQQADAEGIAGLQLLGRLEADGVRTEMGRARALVLPSIWYENFPRTLVEAYANGLPVIASRIGALAELVTDGETGLLFTPGDPADLAAKLRWAHEHGDAMQRMGQAARKRYEALYTGERNHEQLLDIYAQAQGVTSSR